MGRRSDKTKEKEKPCPEKKTEKATRRSHRHSRRRKRSPSVSEHNDSATEENDTSLKGSQAGAEEEQGDKEGMEEVNEGNTDAKEKDVEDEVPKVPPSRRSSRKQTAGVEGSAKTEDKSPSDDEWKEDKSFWEGEEGTAEVSDVRHKDRDGKSSVWQVKSSNGSGGGGGGEIKKIKLCIVRPSETSEPSPRRRKRLSRTVGSHRDKADTQECEEVDDDRGEEKKNVSGSSDEGQNLKAFTEIIKDEGKVSLKEDAEQRGVSEERSPRSQSLSEEGQQGVLQNEDQVEAADEVGHELAEDKQNLQNTEVKEDIPVQVADLKDSISSETSEKLCVVQKSCDMTLQDDNSVEDSTGGQAESEEQVVEQKDSDEVKDLNAVSCEEEPEEKLELPTAGETKSEEELQNVEHLSQERTNDSEATVEVSEPCDVEDKNTICAEEDANAACASTDGDRTSTEELKEGTATEERHEVKDSSEGRPEEMQETAEEGDACEERLVAHNSSPRTKLANSVEEGRIHDSSEETSTYHEESKSNAEDNGAEVKDSTKGSSRDKSDRKTATKRVFLEERSHTRDSSEEKPVHEIKRRRQSRESNSSRSFSRSPGKQVHRRGDRESSRRNRIQDTERSDKHNKKRDISRNSSSDRQGSWHSRRRSCSPQRQREKISLRRSFSKRNNSHEEEKADVKDEAKNAGSSPDEAQPCNKEEDKENVRKTSEQSGTPLEPSQNVTRRRRWGAGKTSRASKKPVLSISTDSLKSLIPGAKPVPVSEVQLSQEEEDRRERESEQERDESDKREKSRNKDKVSDNQDILDKRSVGPMTVSEPHKISVAVTDVHRGKTASRKISIVSDDARTLQNSPSPPRHKVSDVLFISNLVRPFTVNQLKELLARTGTILEGGFWIDKIKSKCYVQYKTEAEARETRHALHGVRWPVSNPKQLCVDFGKKEDMDLAQALTEEDQVPRKTEPLKVERSVEGWVAEQVREKERERELREREREREREKNRVKERPHHAVPAVETLERNRNMKMLASVREWDLGKIGQLSPTEKEPKREEKSKERERRVRKEKIHHSRSASPHDAPARKQKKKEEEAPAKLLDDLFRKTKSTPCIYWLPLTAEQIVVKEEMRRRHMAEHERRMAEVRKAERERERVRAQQRQQRRTGERDKRRRRTASGSPKK